jgi:putative membrane protein
MSDRLLTAAGLMLLAFAWAGPLPQLVPGSFAAHMFLHMLVVGIAAPVLAAGLASRIDVAHLPLSLVVAASLLDLLVVWLWHVPVLHHASRSEGWVLALEQASFAAVALLVWLTALAGPPLAGALTLFFTSMHMTLLGALLGLAPRPIYGGHSHTAPLGLDPLMDQQLGGTVMLAVGSVVYLAGGLFLASRALRMVSR